MAWQRQCRDRYAHLPGPVVTTADLKTARVRPVSRTLATQIILRYEWLGTMVGTNYHYGIFFGMHCAGVCCLGLNGGGANMDAAKELGLTRQTMGYLARGACVHWAPPGTNSRLVAWTARLFARATGAKALIAYADTDAGEIGTIYQACGWIYIGVGSPTAQWVAPSGRVYDQKLAWNLAQQHGHTPGDYRVALRRAGWSQQRSNPKHRYVCLLDPRDAALVARLRALRRPYPKRAVSRDSAASPHQGEEGDANSTTALHPTESC
jgi:hypothetical protein